MIRSCLAGLCGRRRGVWGVALVQAYCHSGADLRYNIVFEQGLPAQTVVLEPVGGQLHTFSKVAGTRLRCFDSALDRQGQPVI